MLCLCGGRREGHGGGRRIRLDRRSLRARAQTLDGGGECIDHLFAARTVGSGLPREAERRRRCAVSPPPSAHDGRGHPAWLSRTAASALSTFSSRCATRRCGDRPVRLPPGAAADPDVALERLDGRLGRLGATQEGVLAGLHGAARAALGEQVALTGGVGPPRGMGVVTMRMIPRRSSVIGLRLHRTRPRARRPRPQESWRRRQAMRDCSDHSSMKPGEAVWENRPPDSANEARLAS